MRTIPAELEAKIDEVHSWMLDGDLDKVAKMTKKCKEYVCKVLRKKAFNSEVVIAGIQVMNENKAKFEINHSMKIAS